MQVFMVIWYVLKSPLILGSRFVTTSQFICIADWLAWCDFSPGGDFPTDSSSLSTFLMLLTLLLNTLRKLQITSFRTFS